MQMHEGKQVAAVKSNGARMSLSAITRGKIAKPQRVVLYSAEGVGKSTWAAGAPAPIFLCSESGTEHLDVARFPAPSSWRDVLEALDVLAKEPHDYRTVVIDTLDWLEPMVWAHTCATKKNGNHRAEHIEDYGFAKGYIYALDVWRQMLARLDVLRDTRSMHAILIAHSQVRIFQSPNTEDFARYELKLHGKASALVKEWADSVLFAEHETLTHEQNKRTKGISTGERVVHTTRTAAYDAKNRAGLPETISLSWEAFAAAIDGATPQACRDRIAELLEGASDELCGRVHAALVKAGDELPKLARIEAHLRIERSKDEEGKEGSE
jgi:hypothetical protein